VGELERLVEQLMQQVMQLLASHQALANHLATVCFLHTACLNVFRLDLHGISASLTQLGSGRTMRQMCQQVVMRCMIVPSIHAKALIWFLAAAGKG